MADGVLSELGRIFAAAYIRLQKVRGIAAEDDNTTRVPVASCPPQSVDGEVDSTARRWRR